MDFSHSAAAPPPPSPQTNRNSNSSAPSRDTSSNLTSGTAPHSQSQSPPRPQSSRPPSYPQHTPTTSSLTFRAPAHRHAHHLHSIPPREKSTRTLIIDHLLWVQALTRFAQARAELAMTDRTGGPGAPNYARRERPEQWDENEEVSSEEEQDDVDGQRLRASSGRPDHVDDQDEEKAPARQDLPFARRLRQRAESLENVITSMIEQPPRDIPFPEDEPIAPPPPLVTSSPVGKHVLPNGVRLRLALTTIINDLFARQDPVHRHLHFQGAVPAVSSSASESNSGASSPGRATQTSLPSLTPSPAPFSRLLPQSLVPLLPMSRKITSVPSTPSPSLPFAIDSPCPRVRDMFTAGAAHPGTVSPTPLPRCPRHLHHSCKVCIVPGRGAYTTTTRTRGASRTDLNALLMAQGGGISGFGEGVGIGSGLARSATSATLLRRGIVSSPSAPSLDDETYLTEEPGTPPAQGVGNAILAGLIPRFVRLSALVALELGREVSAEEIGPSSGTGTGSGSGPDNKRLAGAALVPTVQWYLLLAGLLTRAALEGYLTAEWRGLAPLQVLLGFGLGGAAIPHEADGDDGAVPRSLGVSADDKNVEFEPDGMPDLADAVDVLFPSWRANSSAGGATRDESGGGGEEGRGENDGRIRNGRNDGPAGVGGGEAEYAREMGQRLARFLDIPAGTRDLATHLEDLTWRYPVEPVERAALRFCEALARWRGKPEIATYKKRSLVPGHHVSVSVPMATMKTPPYAGGIWGAADAAVRSAIGRYFVIPPRTTTTTTTMTTATAATATGDPADVLVSDEEGDEDGKGRVVIGRKRAHSAMSGAEAAATGSDRSAAAGDRWRERRGHI